MGQGDLRCATKLCFVQSVQATGEMVDVIRHNDSKGPVGAYRRGIDRTTLQGV